MDYKTIRALHGVVEPSVVMELLDRIESLEKLISDFLERTAAKGES